MQGCMDPVGGKSLNMSLVFLATLVNMGSMLTGQIKISKDPESPEGLCTKDQADKIWPKTAKPIQLGILQIYYL